ncbi:MAG: bifunctional riboflavin kinase/FAD synthetase [Chloroflexi bacterium]|nr:bifunctional riboflavin kinase/FAD synthetase [Chloroflexota bacterium]
MNLITSLEGISSSRSWITVGTFDGVHRGHQFLIGQLVDQAHRSKEAAIVITFWPHPATFFHRAPLANALTSPEEREALLLELGVDQVLTLQFDHPLAEIEAADFMQILKNKLNVVQFFAGPNFALGKGRTGSLPRLEEISRQLGFEIKQMDPLLSRDGMISSSQIRADLASQRLREANQKLGRAYSLSGAVIHGEHRGEKLGIPTANLDIPSERLVPANGVYVTRALLNGRAYDSVTNIGVRPTFQDPLAFPRVEPHLLDFKEQLYGHPLTLQFIDFLRPEIKFASGEALVAQIQKDIASAREVLRNEN